MTVSIGVPVEEQNPVPRFTVQFTAVPEEFQSRYRTGWIVFDNKQSRGAQLPIPIAFALNQTQANFIAAACNQRKP